MLVNTCPGCKSNQFNFVGNRGTSIYLTIEEETFCQPEYQIKHCKNCGLYYKSDTIDFSKLHKYYSKADFLRYEYKTLFPTERAIIEVLRKLPDGSNILDYGCSTGRILSQVVDRHNCFGIELNIVAREIAKEKGVKILEESELTKIKNIKFDAIVLSDVFEHLPYPTALLEKIITFLQPSGSLIICTGNADAPACQRDIANFWYFRILEHLLMFSKEYANFLCINLNLELKLWQEISHYEFSIYQKLRQILQDFAYWQFHGKANPLVKGLLKFIPFLRRAEKWTCPPHFSWTNDHVLVIIKKKC